MGFYQAQKIEALEARIAELEAEILAGNDWLNARASVLQELAEANARIAELEKELARERPAVTSYSKACYPRGWHD